MRRSQRIMKQIQDLNAKQEQILEAAEAAGNGGILTEEQQKQFDGHQTEKQKLGDLRKAALAVEETSVEANALQREPLTGSPITSHGATATSAQVAGAITLPANVRRHGALQAFKGPNADRDAFIAGQWVLATFAGNHPLRGSAAEWCQANGVNTTLMTTDNASAGFLVPNVMEFAIVELAEEFGVFRRFAEIQPMTSGTWSGPRWTASMVGYWVAQGGKPTASDPRWDQITLVAKDLAGMTKVSNQLNEDSVVNLGDKVAMCAALAFSSKEDAAGFDGDGTSTYGGIAGLNTKLLLAANTASLHACAATHTTLASITLADFNGLLGKYPEYPGAKPAWFCHKAVWAASMVPLQLAAGGATPLDIASGGKPTFLGYPVIFAQSRPSTYAVSTVPVIFGDLRLSSKLGDRRGRAVQSGWENDDFTKQQFTLLATERVDIVNHTIVDPLDTAKAGPVMGLQLAAA